MITPVYKNIEYLNDFYLERSLPNKGKLLVNEGEDVFSYTKVGYSKNAAHELIIPKNLKFNPKLKNKKFIKSGDLLAFKETTYLFAPFDGYIEEKNGGRFLVKHQEDFWLLSGVSGFVVKVIPSKSCLIKSSGYKIKFFETSTKQVEGELKVLPNPSELLEIDFMQRYIKNGIGQIVYTGDYLRKSLLEKAIEIGCEGVICGSCDRETLLFAKENNFFVGILSGFGRIPVREKIWKFLKTFKSKYVIVREGSNNLFISELNSDYKNESSFTNLKVGLPVIVLDYPYFGWEGIVTGIEHENVRVKIIKLDEIVSTHYSNLIS